MVFEQILETVSKINSYAAIYLLSHKPACKLKKTSGLCWEN